MKQYCRYCINLITGNGTWCDAKKKTLRDNTAKSVNNCKLFEFCEMDAFAETDGYKPRQQRKDTDQISLFNMEGETDGEH